MISTITIKRMTTAKVVIEHPDEWDAKETRRAVQNRALDVAGKANFWEADSKSTIGDVTLDEDARDPEDEYAPEPFALTADDLDDMEHEEEEEEEEEPEEKPKKPAKEEKPAKPAADETPAEKE